MILNTELVKYIESNILPQYDSFDDAHKRDHVEHVISMAIELASIYNIDANMAYTASAFHDIGLSKGRKLHEIHSYNEVLHDTNLPNFFSNEEIMEIAIACKEHRASTLIDPSTISLLSKIIRDSDRNSDIETMIKRSYKYNRKTISEPNLLYNEVKKHLVSKFGKNGYVIYHLPEIKNTKSLKEAQHILENENLFRIKYDEIVKKK